MFVIRVTGREKEMMLGFRREKKEGRKKEEKSSFLFSPIPNPT